MNKRMCQHMIYLDCFSGVSGDMVLGALLDLGLSFESFKKSMKTLPIEGLEITTEKVKRHGIAGTNVHLEFKLQPLRHLAQITEIITNSSFSTWVRDHSMAVINKIHFHEIGAADTIIDIIGSFYLLEELGKPDCCASPLNLGGGFVNTEHGKLPVPTPATVELLQGIPVYSGINNHELVTPTGAAIIAHVVKTFGPLPDMIVEKTGYGAGDKVINEIPNLLRIITGYQEKKLKTETLYLIETTIDDLNPQNYGYVMQRLFEAGALDVTLTPIYMKKNRPGIILSVLTETNLRHNLENIIFQETTTLGIRTTTVERKCLDRSIIQVTVQGCHIDVKIAFLEKEAHLYRPEYEDCQKAARKLGIPLQLIQEQAIIAAKSNYSD